MRALLEGAATLAAGVALWLAFAHGGTGAAASQRSSSAAAPAAVRTAAPNKARCAPNGEPLVRPGRRVGACAYGSCAARASRHENAGS
jgi:hypothetical protein